MNNPQPPGPPSGENLRHLYNALPGMVEQLEQKRELRGEKRVGQSLPKKLCNVCGRGFDRSYLTPKDFVPDMDGPCPRCDDLLKDGWGALVAGNNFAFIKSEALHDMMGKVTKIGLDVMRAIEKHFKLEWQTKEQEPATETPQ